MNHKPTTVNAGDTYLQIERCRYHRPRQHKYILQSDNHNEIWEYLAAIDRGDDSKHGADGDAHEERCDYRHHSRQSQSPFRFHLQVQYDWLIDLWVASCRFLLAVCQQKMYTSISLSGQRIKLKPHSLSDAQRNIPIFLLYRGRMLLTTHAFVCLFSHRNSFTPVNFL